MMECSFCSRIMDSCHGTLFWDFLSCTSDLLPAWARRLPQCQAQIGCQTRGWPAVGRHDPLHFTWQRLTSRSLTGWEDGPGLLSGLRKRAALMWDNKAHPTIQCIKSIRTKPLHASLIIRQLREETWRRSHQDWHRRSGYCERLWYIFKMIDRTPVTYRLNRQDQGGFLTWTHNWIKVGDIFSGW